MASKRSRDIVVALEIETTSDTYNAPSSTDDVLPITDASFNPEAEQLADGRRTGGLDEGDLTVGKVPIVGSLTTELLGDIATPAAPANLKKLFRIAGWLFATQAVVPTTGVGDVSAGGVNQLTIDLTTETDFSSVDGAYVGMDVELSAVPAVTERRTVATYEVTGTNAVMTFTKAPSVTLTTGTKVKVLAQERAVLHAGDIPTASVDFYLAGRKSAHRGVCADLSMNWAAGARATISATLRGKFQGARSDVTQPTPSLPSTLAPVWRGGIMRVGGVLTRVNSLTHSLGNTLGTYGDPEDSEGFTAHEITRRGVRMTLDPKLGLMSDVDWSAILRAGTERLIHAQIGAAVGNRVSLLVQRAKTLSLADKDQEGLAGEDVGFKCEGRDAVVSIMCWS